MPEAIINGEQGAAVRAKINESFSDLSALQLAVAGLVDDLATGLSGKSNVGHAHAISDVTGLQTALDGKQASLVSGTSIKTVNGMTLLGSGDLVVSGSVSDGDKGDITVSGSGSTWSINNAAVTDAKISNRTALSVFGRSANSSGVGADIAAGTDGHVLRRSGTSLGFGQVATAGLADAAATNAKLANMANATVKGRNTAGTGVPEDVTMAQLKTLLALAISDISGLQDALNDLLSADLATEITATKSALVGADRSIFLDSEASDEAKLGTLDSLRTFLANQPVGAGLGTTGSVALDLAALTGTVQTITATGNLTFTTSNRAAGRAFELRIAAGGSSRTLTWPSWVAYGAALPTTLGSGKVLRVAISCTGSADTDIDAAAAESV